MSNSFSLAIGEELIRVVDGQLSKDKIIINAAAYDNINENIYVDNSGKISIDTANKIVKLINDAGISKRQVNIIIPDGFSYTRIIEMPLLSDKELLSAIKYQADQFIPIAIDNLDLDAITIYQDKSNNKQYILIVACVKTLIDKISKLVEKAGFRVQKLEIKGGLITSIHLIWLYISNWILAGHFGPKLIEPYYDRSFDRSGVNTIFLRGVKNN